MILTRNEIYLHKCMLSTVDSVEIAELMMITRESTIVAFRKIKDKNFEEITEGYTFFERQREYLLLSLALRVFHVETIMLGYQDFLDASMYWQLVRNQLFVPELQQSLEDYLRAFLELSLRGVVTKKAS